MKDCEVLAFSIYKTTNCKIISFEESDMQFKTAKKSWEKLWIC